MSEADTAARMVTELVRLHQALKEVSFPVDLDGAEEARATRTELVNQLGDYVIPRMMTIEAPLLAVVGGSTGSGKSTLVNSLVGERVTTPGLLRPTTRAAVLVHHPDDARWFGQDRLLPQLTRVEYETDNPHALQLVATKQVPQGLAILDAPDIDSVEEANRLLAAQLLAAADLWLFVTSAARYADQVPWDFLRAAAERQAAVAIVLDRTSPESIETVVPHLARMLASRGLKDSPLFSVPETEPSAEGLLPTKHVKEIRSWLAELAANPEARHAVAHQTLDGAVRALTFRTHGIADAAAAQAEAIAALDAAADSAYASAKDELETSRAAGEWQRGDAAVQARSLATQLDGKKPPKLKALAADKAKAVIGSAVELVILDAAEQAAATVAETWQARGGSTELVRDSDIFRASRGLRAATARAVEDWLHDVLDLSRSAVEGSAAAGSSSAPDPDLITLAVGHGLLGGEVARAQAEAQIDHLLGAGRAGVLLTGAQTTLTAQIGALLRAEQGRFTAVIDALGFDTGAVARLREAARRVDDVRYAAQIADPLGLA